MPKLKCKSTSKVFKTFALNRIRQGYCPCRDCNRASRQTDPTVPCFRYMIQKNVNDYIIYTHPKYHKSLLTRQETIIRNKQSIVNILLSNIKDLTNIVFDYVGDKIDINHCEKLVSDNQTCRKNTIQCDDTEYKLFGTRSKKIYNWKIP